MRPVEQSASSLHVSGALPTSDPVRPVAQLAIRATATRPALPRFDISLMITLSALTRREHRSIMDGNPCGPGGNFAGRNPGSNAVALAVPYLHYPGKPSNVLHSQFD